jgi:hypothetical protein
MNVPTQAPAAWVMNPIMRSVEKKLSRDLNFNWRLRGVALKYTSVEGLDC